MHSQTTSRISNYYKGGLDAAEALIARCLSTLVRHWTGGGCGKAHLYDDERLRYLVHYHDHPVSICLSPSSVGTRKVGEFRSVFHFPMVRGAETLTGMKITCERLSVLSIMSEEMAPAQNVSYKRAHTSHPIREQTVCRIVRALRHNRGFTPYHITARNQRTQVDDYRVLGHTRGWGVTTADPPLPQRRRNQELDDLGVIASGSRVASDDPNSHTGTPLPRYASPAARSQSSCPWVVKPHPSAGAQCCSSLTHSPSWHLHLLHTPYT
jgi:hypothetical protein